MSCYLCSAFLLSTRGRGAWLHWASHAVVFPQSLICSFFWPDHKLLPMSSTAQALHVSCRTFAPRHCVETESAPSEGLEESESLVLRVLRVEHFCDGFSVEQDVEVERPVQPRIVRKPTEMVHLCAASSPTHRCQSLPDC